MESAFVKGSWVQCPFKMKGIKTFNFCHPRNVFTRELLLRLNVKFWTELILETKSNKTKEKKIKEKGQKKGHASRWHNVSNRLVMKVSEEAWS